MPLRAESAAALSSGSTEPAHERVARRGRRTMRILVGAGALLVALALGVGPARLLDLALAPLGPVAPTDPPRAAWSAWTVRDADADGRADVAVLTGALGVARAEERGRTLAIFSGASGERLSRRRWEGPEHGARGAERAGDVDGDGVLDVVEVENGREPDGVAWGDADTWRLGRVVVRSGADGRVLLELGPEDVERSAD